MPGKSVMLSGVFGALVGFALAALLGAVLVGILWIFAFAQGLSGQSEFMIPGLVEVYDDGRTVSSSIRAGALMIPVLLATVGAVAGGLIGRLRAIKRLSPKQ